MRHMEVHTVHISIKVLMCTLTCADTVNGGDGGQSKSEQRTQSSATGVHGEPLDSSRVKRVMMGEGRVRKE